MKRIIATLAIALATLSAAHAQSVPEGGTEAVGMDTTATDSARPYRTIRKDGWPLLDFLRPMYISSGFTTDGSPIGPETSDIKFQASFRLNLLHNLWGLNFEFFVGYSQISVWDIYRHSSPFYDNTYIPGVYTYVPLKNKKTGIVSNSLLFGYEHRSNGKDDHLSRSVNYAFLTYTHEFPFGLNLQATGRFGDSWYGDSHNFELYNRYLGYLILSAVYTTPNKNLEVMVSAAPLNNRSVANVTAEIGFRPVNKPACPYIFVQYHYGYDEACRDCLTSGDYERIKNGTMAPVDGNKYFYDGTAPIAPKQMIRFGVMFSPHNYMRGNL